MVRSRRASKGRFQCRFLVHEWKKMPASLKSGLGQQDSRSLVLDGKDTSGLKGAAKTQKSTRPDSVWPEAWRYEREEEIAESAEINAKLQTTRGKRRVYEVSADDKKYLKVIAEAHRKLESDNVLVMHRFLGKSSSGSPPACETLVERHWDARHGRKNKFFSVGTHLWTRTCRNCKHHTLVQRTAHNILHVYITCG